MPIHQEIKLLTALLRISQIQKKKKKRHKLFEVRFILMMKIEFCIIRSKIWRFVLIQKILLIKFDGFKVKELNSRTKLKKSIFNQIIQFCHFTLMKPIPLISKSTTIIVLSVSVLFILTAFTLNFPYRKPLFDFSL